MNEQQEKAKFRQAIDQTLVSLEGDPFLYQRVTALAEKTVAKAEHMVRKVVVIALIAILCMATMAVASSVYGGAISWTGEVIGVEDADAVEGLTRKENAPKLDSLEVRLDELADLYQQDGEALEITASRYGRVVSGRNNSVSRTVDTMDAFIALMSEEKLPIPEFIPDGYEFSRAYIEYRCRAEGEWLLIEKMEMEDEIVVERYRAEEEDLFVSSYGLYIRNLTEPDACHIVTAQLLPSGGSDQLHLRFGENEMAQVLAIPGMDDAMAAVKENKYEYVMMRRVLEEPVAYRTFHGFGGSFDEILFHVDVPGIDEDTLSRMFAAE